MHRKNRSSTQFFKSHDFCSSWRPRRQSLARCSASDLAVPVVRQKWIVWIHRAENTWVILFGQQSSGGRIKQLTGEESHVVQGRARAYPRVSLCSSTLVPMQSARQSPWYCPTVGEMLIGRARYTGYCTVLDIHSDTLPGFDLLVSHMQHSS